MRPFAELTPAGRGRRLHALATAVVRDGYGLPDPAVRRIAAPAFNTVFRVDAGGARYVLRVGDACRIHVDGLEAVEAAWLRAIARDGVAVAPVAVPTPDGRLRIDGAHPGVDGVRGCSLFSFVAGRPLAGRATATAIAGTGELLARLHDHAASVDLDVNDAPRWDRVAVLPRVDRLDELTGRVGALPAEARDRVEEVLAALWADPPHAPHLLHGDWSARNVLTWRGRLRPVDFQDLQLGFAVQDVAVTLDALGRNAPDLAPAFLDGYRRVRPAFALPPELRDALAAGRALTICNLAIHLARPRWDEFVAARLEPVRRWMGGAGAGRAGGRP